VCSIEEEQNFVGENEHLKQYNELIEKITPEYLIGDFNDCIHLLQNFKVNFCKGTAEKANCGIINSDYKFSVEGIAELYYSLAEIGFALICNSSLCEDEIVEILQQLNFIGLNTRKSPIGAPLLTEVLTELNSYILCSLNLCEMVENFDLKPYLYLLNANILNYKGDSWGALNNYSLALIACKETNYTINASILAEFGHFYYYQLSQAVYLSLKDQEHVRIAGIKMMERSIKILEAESNSCGLACVCHELALIQQERNQFGSSLFNLKRAFGIYEHTMQMKKAAIALLEIGKICEHMGNSDGAIESYQSGLTICTQYEFKEESAKILVNLALIYANRGDMNMFNKFIDQAEQIEKHIEQEVAQENQDNLEE
jgi:tetratricopeptide (TPR) repeat protein